MVVVLRVETSHVDDPDKYKLSELEYGLKQLYKRRVGQSCFDREWDREKIWKCPYPNCDFESAKIKQTRHHVETVHQKIRYKCTVVGCDQEFMDKTTLKTHLDRVHRQIRKYKCQYCEKTFKTAAACKEHEMIHTGERPFKCPGCGKGFIQATPWKKHMRNVCKVPIPEKKNVNGHMIHECKLDFLKEKGIEAVPGRPVQNNNNNSRHSIPF